MKSLGAASVAACVLFAGAVAGAAPANFSREAAAAPRVIARVAPGQPRLLWAPPGRAAVPLSPLAPEARPEAAARSALASASRQLGIPASALGSAELRELHDLGRGPVIARFQQKHLGLDVFGRELKVVMDRDLRPVAFSGSFSALAAKQPRSRAQPLVFALPPAAAVAAALRDLAASSGVPGLRLLGAPPRLVSVFYADTANLIPAYRFSLRAAQADQSGILAFGYVVSATDGAILVRKNMAQDVAFTYRAYADPTAPYLPADGPLGNGRTPFPNANFADNPARVPMGSALISLQNGPIATNDPWLPSAAGSTLGNNVDAYSDLDPPDGIGSDERAPITATRTFNHASTADANPSTTAARRAGIVNLFYVNNYLHDWWYGHGFDEAAGNAQASNFGRGGVENDRLLTESQDFSGRNNANMYTPADGESPIMQMFLYSGGLATFTVDQPALGPMPAELADFGPAAFDLTDDVALVNDGVGTTGDGCEAFAGVGGKIALIDRGDCFFTDKALNAQNAGASGVVIVNNVANDGAPAMGGSDPGITIPIMSLSLEDGATLKNALGSGAVIARLTRAAGADRDSALDNGIIAHEWFHYASNRLVGDGFGLINSQGAGMGEGWSDFASLLLVVRPDDTGVAGNADFGGAYGLGVYVDNNAYFGPRRAPYSTDYAINPLSYMHIWDGISLPTHAPLQYGADGANNSEVHATGEIWANTLWAVYAALLNDPRYTFAQAQSRMMDYVIAGLKATPNAPTLLEARDALLAAARATDSQDFALMANAFAGQGMGVGALAPDRYSQTHNGAIESHIGMAAGYSISDLALDFGYEDGTLGYCDVDEVLDPGETVVVSFTVTSNGTEDLPAGALIRVFTDGDTTLPDGNFLTLPALAIGESATLSLPLTLDSAAAIASPLTITADPLQAGNNVSDVIEPWPVTRTIHANMDLQKSISLDDVEITEATLLNWIPQISDPSVGRTWVVESFDQNFATGQAWHGVDNGARSTSTLTSPPFTVNGAFSLSFEHVFAFEEPQFDGGVIEVSLDGGAWQDAIAFGATFTQGNGYNGVASAFDAGNPRPAFVDFNAAIDTTAFEAMTLAFGNLLAGHSVRLRFRIETDESVGAFGWVVDNLAFSGLAAPIFWTPGVENGACVNRPPYANAGTDSSIDEGFVALLSGSARDLDGTAGLSYSWSRVSGPAVTLVNANKAVANFTAPQVSADTPVVLRLTVSDGTVQSADDVVVTIVDVPAAPPAAGGGGAGGGGALGLELSFAALLALARRRRRPVG